jgi:hypothetical protein
MMSSLAGAQRLQRSLHPDGVPCTASVEVEATEPQKSTPGDRRMGGLPSSEVVDGPPSRFQGKASSLEQLTKNSCTSREDPPSSCRLVQVDGGGGG